jgi:hypothetical protein
MDTIGHSSISERVGLALPSFIHIDKGWIIHYSPLLGGIYG